MNAPPTHPPTTGRLPAQRQPHRPRHHDVLDVTLNDEELRAETELTAMLMVAVNECEQPLDQAQVDRLLGLASSD